MEIQTYIFWGVTILSLVLFYLLAKEYIKWYFKSRKQRYDLNSNFLSKYAIGSLLVAFLAINPALSGYFINVIVDVINQIGIIDNKIEPYKYELDILTIGLYAIFALVVLGILFLSYRARNIQFNQEQEAQNEAERKEMVIRYPEPLSPESPHLQERVRELFELKYARHDLKLQSAIHEPNLLYGSYQDQFNTYVEVVYCDDTPNVHVTAKTLEEKHTTIVENIVPKITEDENPIVRVHYIIHSGSFEDSELKINKQTEDEFVNSAIDFSKYLRNRLKYDYEHHKIFSAISKEEDKKTLAETFIAPNYSIGEVKNEQSESDSLKKYVDNWLTDTADSKQLVLLADYGMGKTSFMRHYAATLAQEILDGKPIKRFPVLLSLTNTSPMHGGIDKAVESFVSKELGVDFKLFQKLVEKGKVLFLLDAFDEMGYIGTHLQRFKQFNEIWQLASQNNKILISGRPSYFPSEFEMRGTLNIPDKSELAIQTRPYAERISLETLTEIDIADYIRKYYTEDAEKYIEFIQGNKSLTDLCGRPSLMHIVREMLPTLIAEAKTQELNAGEVMKRYVDYWINRQEAKQVQSAFEGDESRKRRFLLNFYQDLAVDYYLKDDQKRKPSDIIAQLQTAIEKEGISELEKSELREGFESEILSAYFLEIEQDEYRFVHKSFFEYFIASKIMELMEAKKFKHKLFSMEWSDEIIDMVYDAIPERYKNNEVPALLRFIGGDSVAKLVHKMIIVITSTDTIMGISFVLSAIVNIILFESWLSFFYETFLIYIITGFFFLGVSSLLSSVIVNIKRIALSYKIAILKNVNMNHRTDISHP
jgi:hypothetical protein